MDVVCAWCGTMINQGDGQTKEVSHGICDDCYQKQIDLMTKPHEASDGDERTSG